MNYATPFFILCLATISFCQFRKRKPNTFYILSLGSYSGNLPKDGKLCQAAQQMVMDEINNRQDILPDYHLIGDFQDEGPGSMFSLRNAVGFVRRMEQNASVYQSPIALGPLFTPGCKSWGGTAQYFDMVVIASACLAPIYTANRRIFPNLWRTRMSTEIGNFGFLAFIEHVGKWKRIAIYANADNSYNVIVATHFHAISKAAGIEIARFDVFSGITEDIIQTWMDTDIRVIFFQTVDLPTFINFMCLAHRRGMKGSKYVFFISGAIAVDPLSMPSFVGDGKCPKQVIIEQYQQVFISGGQGSAVENSGNTSVLGYDLPAFEERYNSYINYTKTPDYEDRHWCYDRMLQAVIALDKTEKKLNHRNMSLRDYKTSPKVVTAMANQSVGESDFVGLMTNYFKYSKRLELDDQIMYVSAWSPLAGTVALCKITRRQNTSVDDYSAYSSNLVRPPDWRTSDGRPPIDTAHWLDRNLVIGEAVQTTIVVLASFSTVVKIIVGVVATKFKKTKQIVLLTGSICMDGAAIAFVLDVMRFGWPLCLARTFILITGLSLMHGFWFVRLFFLRNCALDVLVTAPSTGNMISKPPGSLPNIARSQQEGANSALQQPVVSNEQPIPTPSSNLRANRASQHGSALFQKSNATKKRKIVLDGKQERLSLLLVFVLINWAVIAALSSWELPWVEKISVYGRPIYHENIDTFIQTFVGICSSETQTAFFGALAVFHFAVLLLGSSFAYTLRNVSLDLDDLMYRPAIVNGATLFTSSVCILFLVESHIGKLIVIAVASLISGVLASVFTLLPSLLEKVRA